MAVGDLTTIDAVRTQLRLEDPLDDAWLESLITSSSAWFKTEVGRDVVSGNYTHTFDGNGSRGLTLRQAPVSAVSSVTVDGVTIPARTSVSGDGWVLDGDRVELVGYTFTRGTQNVVVAYTAGYPAIPAEVAQAVAEHVGLRFRDRDWGGATMKIQSGDLVDHRGSSSSGAWAYISGVIDKYRRVAW